MPKWEVIFARALSSSHLRRPGNYLSYGSLVSQRQRLEEYIAGQNRRESGWGILVDIYCDEAKSGKDMNRPEFQRVLEDVRVGRINLVLTTELSRLSRSIRDFCELWDLFKAHNTRFVTLREQFDTTTAAASNELGPREWSQ